MEYETSPLNEDEIRALFRKPPEFRFGEMCKFFKTAPSMLKQLIKRPSDYCESPHVTKHEKYTSGVQVSKWQTAKALKALSKEERNQIALQCTSKPKAEKPVPVSYTENSLTEKEILKLADNFQQQFKYLYPDRPKPPLYLKNEYNINKLVSTTLCPFKVTMPHELRNWDDSSDFLADYLIYQPLDHPYECPKHLPSLDSILLKRKANSLELSMVLCTLLLASEYIAYVVQGYGTSILCQNYQREKPGPLIKYRTNLDIKDEDFVWNKTEVPIRSKYDLKVLATILDVSTQRSKLLEGQINEGDKPIQTEKDSCATMSDNEDITYDKRVHFWVLICMLDSNELNYFFVEPTTGEKRLVSDSNYLGIECVWNDRNFWCNKQSSQNTCQDLSFDFDDETKWEQFLPKCFFSDSAQFDQNNSLMMPITWIKNMDITHEDLVNKLPEKSKEIVYKTSKVEKHNPYTMGDGLVYKMSYYEDENLDKPLRFHAFYENREDMLVYRKEDYRKNLVNEYFKKGRKDALKEHVYGIDKSNNSVTVMKFYSHFRKDKLLTREWSRTYAKEQFLDRVDKLALREVTYCCKDIEEASENKKEGEEGETNGEQEIAHEQETAEEQETVHEQETAEEQETIHEQETAEEQKPVEENIDEEPVDSGITDEDNIDIDIRIASDETDISVGQEDVTNLDLDTEWVPLETDIEKDFITFRSFENYKILIPGADYTKWNFSDFIDQVHPAERYATSASESEDEDSKLNKKQPAMDAVDDDEYDIKQLSEDEFDTDYQLFLAQLKEELSECSDVNSVFLLRDLYKTLNPLKTEQSRLRKIRKDQIRKARRQYRKPAERVHRKKIDDDDCEVKNYVENLIWLLNLKETFGIQGANSLSPLQGMKLRKSDQISMDGKRQLQSLGKKMQKYYDNIKRNIDKNLLQIKDNYLQNPSVPANKSIKCIWYCLDTDSYRLELDYEDGCITNNIFMFRKPQIKSLDLSDFHYLDEYCKQIRPGLQGQKFKKHWLYLQLVNLLNQEPEVVKEVEELNFDMEQILKTRKKEEEKLRNVSEHPKPVKKDHEEYLKDETFNRAVCEFYSQKVKSDCVAHTIERLYFSYPLTVEQAKKVYRCLIEEFCDKAEKKISNLQKKLDNVIQEYDIFLEECRLQHKTWNSESQKTFIDVYGKTFGHILCLEKRSEALFELLSSKYVELKQSLYNDPKLAAFIEQASKIQSEEEQQNT